jgi:uncharacterized delta-60 repeat protein
MKGAFRAFLALHALAVLADMHAQSAIPDATFGNNGCVIVQNYSNILDVVIHDMDEQPDGKVLLTGSHVVNGGGRAYAQRLNTDGTLDQDFADGGRFLSPEGMGSLGSWQTTLKPDGRILLIGLTGASNAFDITLVQLMPDGTVDYTFGNNGLTTVSADGGLTVASALGMPDGSVYILGTYVSWPSIMHILPNGLPDPAFGTNGMSILEGAPWPAHGLDMQMAPQGYLVLVAGRMGWVMDAWFLAAVDLQGQLVSAFGTNGFVTMDLTDNDMSEEYAGRLVIGADGRIITSGHWLQDQVAHSAYWAFDAFGTVDVSFGENGILALPMPANASVEVSVISLLPDGDLLLSGAQTSSSGLHCKTRLVRLNSDGSLETGFGENGVFLHYRPGAIFRYADKGGLLANGNIAVVGNITASGGATKNGMIVFSLNDISTDLENAWVTSTMVSVHPNPATERIKLVGTRPNASSRWELVDAQGRTHAIRNSSFAAAAGNPVEFEIPADLVNGTYRIVQNDGDQLRSAAFILAR